MKSQHFEEIFEFYNQFGLFKGLLLTEDINTLAMKSNIKQYPSDSIIVQQNENTNSVFFIKSGIVKVLNNINKILL